MITLDKINAAIKEVVLPGLQESIYEETKLFNNLKKNVNVVSYGKDKVEIVYKTSRTFALPTKEDAEIEESGLGVSRMEVEIQNVYARTSVTDKLLRLSNEETVVSWLNELVNDLKASFGKTFDRMVGGDWRWTLMIIDGDQTWNILNIKNIYAITPIVVGMKVYIGTESEILAGTADQVTITNVDESTITVDSSITVSDGDLVVPVSVVDVSAGKFNTIQSLDKIADDGTLYGTTFQGVTRNYYTKWNVVTSTWNIITDFDTVAMKMSNYWYSPDFVYSSVNKYKEFVEALYQNRRTVNSAKDVAGFQAIQYLFDGKNVPVERSTWVMNNRVYFINKDALTVIDKNGVDFIQGTSGYLNPIAGKAAYEIKAVWYGNLGALNTRWTGVIRW